MLAGNRGTHKSLGELTNELSSQLLVTRIEGTSLKGFDFEHNQVAEIVVT